MTTPKPPAHDADAPTAAAAEPGISSDAWDEAIDSWSASLERLAATPVVDPGAEGVAAADAIAAPVSDEASLSAAVGGPIRRGLADDDSGVVRIPNVDELSESYERPRAPAEQRRISPVPSDRRHAHDVVNTEPDGTEPIAHFAVDAEEVLLFEEVEDDEPDSFASEPPADEPVALDPPESAPPVDVTGFVASTPWAHVPVPRQGPTAVYREERLGLLADELEARQLGSSAADDVSWIAVEAARAAHMAGEADFMQRLIERACTAAPDAVAPRRERLRLFLATHARAAVEDDNARVEPLDAVDLQALVDAVATRAGRQEAAYARVRDGLAAVSGRVARVDGADLDAGGALAIARAAARADDIAATADALAAAGSRIGGALGASLMSAAARRLELRGLGDRGSAYRAAAHDLAPGALEHVVAPLRLAGAFSSSSTLLTAQSLLPRLSDATLRGALARWACGLEDGQGTAWGAELLQSVVDGEPMAKLSLPDRIALLPLHLVDVVDNPEGWVDGLAAPDGALLLTTAAEMSLREGDGEHALSLLEAAARVCPNAVYVSLFAERLAQSLPSGRPRLRALDVWGRGDAARVGIAHLESLAEAGSTDQAAHDHHRQAALRALPDDAAFLSLAWAEMAARRWSVAADMLQTGAERIEASGELELAAAIREVADDLHFAELPTRAVVRAMARSSSADETMDHPRVLALAPLEKANAPSAIAAVYRSAAMPNRAVSLRVFEALAWMKAAGQRRQAIQFLQSRWSGGLPSPSASMLMRILANTFEDPDSAAGVYEKLALTAREGVHESFWTFRRAEALAAVARHDEAGRALRDLSGPALQAESEVLYRRLLWAAGDYGALDALLRDEADGYRGVGLADKAAGVLLDRAQVRSQGLRDLDGAVVLLQEALTAAPDEPVVVVRALAAAAALGRGDVVLAALEALARMPDADAAFLRALIAEGQLDHEAVARWVQLAREDVHELRLTLLQRTLVPTAAPEVWQEAVQAAVERGDGDPRLPLALKLRMSESLAATGRGDEALALLDAVITTDGRHLPALRLAARIAAPIATGQRVAALLIRGAEVCLLPAHRAELYLEAAALVQDSDAARAEALVRQALEADPTNDGALQRLRTFCEARDDAAALAELLRVRLSVSLPADEAERLRLERAAWLERAGDRAAAKAELRVLLATDPQNAHALSQLVELEYQDGAYSVAAEIYLRLARLQNEPPLQVQIFRRLGRIYHRRLSDPKLAAGAFERVLKIAPEDQDALAGLSEIYSKQNDLPRAISVTERAMAVEPDERRRLTLLLRLSALHEKSGQTHVAGNLLRRAVELAPRSLQAIGEMARHYERHKDLHARRILLETSLSRLYDDLRRNPGDLSALRAIVPVLRWCARAAGSAATAQLLAVLTEDAGERREMAGWSGPPSRGRRLTPLANPEVDEMSYPPKLPPGLRQVMRVLGPALSRATKPDLRRYGVTRGDRLGVGEGVRVIVDSLAVDLGVRGFEVFVCKEMPSVLAVEPGDPPAIIFGHDVVEAGPIAVRFAAGYALRLVATHFDLLACEDPGAAALLMALVQQFGGAPLPFANVADEARVAAAVPRLTKALSRSLRTELRPFVAEMASPESLANVASAVEETAARVGLLASGDLAVSLNVLLGARGLALTTVTMASVPLATALLDFALSADYELLVRSLDSIS